MSAPEKYHIMRIAQSDPDMNLAIAVLIGTRHFENKSHSTLSVGSVFCSLVQLPLENA